MIGLKTKLIVGAVLAVALAGSGYVVNGWRVDAAAKDAAEQALSDYQAAVADRDKEAAERQANAEKRSEALALRLETASATIEELRRNPIKSVEYRDVPAKNGVCRDARLSAEWFRVRSEAFAAASSAVRPAD